jgi:hypothetical protein
MSRPSTHPRVYTKHGLTPLLSAAAQLEQQPQWLDQLGAVGVALRAWRRDLVTSLGGEATVSTQERTVIELATKTYLLLESVDRWLLAQPSLINKSRRALFPIVLQRQQLADSLSRYMGQLGLQRRALALGRIILWLFPAPDGERLQSFRKTWRTACRKAGLGHRLVHDLRRTAVRALDRWRVPERGHEDGGAFDRGHVSALLDCERGGSADGRRQARRAPRPGASADPENCRARGPGRKSGESHAAALINRGG